MFVRIVFIFCLYFILISLICKINVNFQFTFILKLFITPKKYLEKNSCLNLSKNIS